MALPKITFNDGYDDDGKSLLDWVVSETVVNELSKILDKSRSIFASNPYNNNGHLSMGIDKWTGVPCLKFNDKRVIDAIIVDVFFSRIYLQLILENGEREPYTCESKDELELIRKNLGQSSLDRTGFKL